MTETSGAGPEAPTAEAPAEPNAGPPPPRRSLSDLSGLRRSRYDRKIAGVAGGLGRYLDLDPTLIRVLLVVLALFGGAGVILYAAAWLLVPEEETEETVVSTNESLRTALLIGALALAGLTVLSTGLTGDGFGWVAAIIAIVVAVLLTRDRSRTGPAVAPMPPGPSMAYTDVTQGAPPSPWGHPPTGYVVPPPPRRRKPGPVLFGLTLALIALGLGLLGLYDATGGAVTDAAYPALALALIGAMLVLGSFWGRPGGLILLGVIASLATLVAGATEPSFTGDRDQVYRPTSATQLEDSYFVPAGRLEVDLTDLSEVEALDGRTLRVGANVGEVVVIVPREATVDVDAAIEFGGAIDLPGRTTDGWDPSVTRTLTGTDSRARFDLDLDLRAGHIEVRQQ